jgi:tetratricopeptide (TPR) repeat protein
LFSVGCSTHAKRIAQPRNLFYNGQIVACRESLEKLSKANRHDRDVVNLDLAVVDLLCGEAKKAEGRLKEVRDRFDHLEQDSITEKTVSMWTDDQVRSYAGEDYEKILIRIFLSLTNLMHDGTDAESYTLQIQDKHEQLAERFEQSSGKKKQEYTPLPLGFYMRGMLREATHRDYDDAVRNYEIAAQLLPNNQPLSWDLARVRSGVHSHPGHGVVYVFAMVGRGPHKIEVAEQPTSDALLIADRIISAVGPYKLPPTIAPIKIPDIAITPSDVESVGVQIDSQPIGPTASLANVDELAVSTYQANRNAIVARAVARRVIKKATIVAAKDSISKNNWTSLGMDVAGIAWEASEGADTRCWGLLPRDIQVLRVEVPAGDHRLSLNPLMANRPVGPSQSTSVHVVDGQNTYVLCWFPDSRSVSQIMCSSNGN